MSDAAGWTEAQKAAWLGLSWSDLEAWTDGGSFERGLDYQRRGRVEALAAGENGRLVASVVGTERYLVTAWLEDRENDVLICSACSCPVGHDGCKHAVAAVGELLERGGGELPRASEHGLAGLRAGSLPDERIREHLASRSAASLAELIWSLAGRYPEVREDLEEMVALRSGDIDRIVAEVRGEIDEVTSVRVWRSNWTGEGEATDYSRLHRMLEGLLDAGRGDELVALGRDLLEQGMEQISESHDEGETARALGDCMGVVFRGVARSSLTGPEKILYVIDACLADEFDLLDEGVEEVLEQDHVESDWSAVADVLSDRLSQAVDPGAAADGVDRFMRRFERDRLADWLLAALTRAGRGDELRAILEREARVTGAYGRLVDHLIEAGDGDAARRWAIEGIERTRDEFPGSASGLAASMCELARREERWADVAAHAARRFFDVPGEETFAALIEAAGRAGCGEAVRRAALSFLETGRRPDGAARGRKGGGADAVAWPLPVPAELSALGPGRGRGEGPRLDVLIDLAIAEGRPEEALRWHDRLAAKKRRDPFISDRSDAVAAAVAETHPERALEIYRARVESNLPIAERSAYEAIGSYLRKMRPIFAGLGRESDWEALVAELRERYRRRPRFVEVLDGLKGPARRR